MINVKAISSLEKVMPKDTFESFKEVTSLKALKGERVSFQVIVENPITGGWHGSTNVKLSIESELAPYVTVRSVGYVPSEMPVYADRCSGDHITKEPGLFPDVLYPVKEGETVYTNPYMLKTFWITAELPKEMESGEYPLTVVFTNAGNSEIAAKAQVNIDIAKTAIEASDLRYTQWFHCDCIAEYFGTEMMSERHWRLIEGFIETAAHTGVNMILTPIFTPPLDTAIGTERPTMQLVGISLKDGVYSFDFTLLDRWVELCGKYGIRYFEMAHLFTQWGAAACPKIEVTVDGRKEKLFGWHVPASSDSYRDFLCSFLPALVQHLNGLGIAENCYFHISDEPSGDPARPDYENYVRAKEIVKKHIGKCKIMDALSNTEFFDNGLIEYPVVATNHIKPFMERDIKERWCYYCCGQGELVANRFMAMPSYRNRVSGVQFYMNGMDGFLQWGYNFYNSRLSEHRIDPYLVTDGMHSFPSGDAFSVYPYEDGAIESLRAVVFYEGLQDRMILKELEGRIGADKVRDMIRDIAGCDVTFEECLSAEILATIHDRAIEMLG